MWLGEVSIRAALTEQLIDGKVFNIAADSASIILIEMAEMTAEPEVYNASAAT